MQLWKVLPLLCDC